MSSPVQSACFAVIERLAMVNHVNLSPAVHVNVPRIKSPIAKTISARLPSKEPSEIWDAASQGDRHPRRESVDQRRRVITSRRQQLIWETPTDSTP